MAQRRGIRMKFTAFGPRTKAIPTGPMLVDLAKANHDWCWKVVNKVKKYPPQETKPGPEGGRTRTYVLLKSWQVKPRFTADRIAHEIMNFARESDRPRGKYYARIVHGPGTGDPAGQGTAPDMFLLGWRNIDEVVAAKGTGKNAVGSRAEHQAAMQRIVNRHLRAG